MSDPSTKSCIAFVGQWWLPTGSRVERTLAVRRSSPEQRIAVWPEDIRTDALYPDLAPAKPISGAEAFDRHIEHTVPLLRETGGPCLIGPGDERWNLAMRVRQAGAVSFPSFVSHAAYLAGLGHRIAVVVDSGLPPLSEMSRPVAVERATP